MGTVLIIGLLTLCATYVLPTSVIVSAIYQTAQNREAATLLLMVFNLALALVGSYALVKVSLHIGTYRPKYRVASMIFASLSVVLFALSSFFTMISYNLKDLSATSTFTVSLIVFGYFFGLLHISRKRLNTYAD